MVESYLFKIVKDSAVAVVTAFTFVPGTSSSPLAIANITLYSSSYVIVFKLANKVVIEAPLETYSVYWFYMAVWMF